MPTRAKLVIWITGDSDENEGRALSAIGENLVSGNPDLDYSVEED